tara:strand:+ start:5798 stop:6949 length:1152 start_codon:yes stop_codon:yes gene_type:complete
MLSTIFPLIALGSAFGSREEYSENFDLVRTLENRQKQLVAQELEKSYMFKRFKETAQVVKCYDNIEVPVYLGPGTAGKWMQRGDLLPDAQDTKTAKGFYNNRYLAVPAGIDKIDQYENEGNPGALLKLTEYNQWEAMLAHFRAMSFAVFSGAGGAQPDGLSTIFEKSTPATQTAVIGGIDKSLRTWWRNQYVQLTQNFGYVAPGTSLPAGFIALLQLIRQCTVGTLVPSDLVTTQNTFENIKRGMLEIGAPQYMLQKRIDADFGVNSFAFDGQDVSWDPYCAADTIYCMHLRDKFEASRTGKNDKTKIATDFESVAKSSVLSLNGGLFMLKNPNVNMRQLAPRSPYRQLHETKWWIDSFNLGVFRMSDHGVAGSDTGSRWETW